MTWRELELIREAINELASDPKTANARKLLVEAEQIITQRERIATEGLAWSLERVGKEPRKS